MIKIKFNSHGQTLIESIVALGVAGLIIGAITLAIITSLNNATFSKNQNLATQLAQQGMDVMRQLRDSNWDSFDSITINTVWCLNQGQKTITTTTCTLIDGVFTRKVIVNDPLGSSCATGKKVSIRVYWSDGSCGGTPNCHSVSLNSCFAQLNSVSFP